MNDLNRVETASIAMNVGIAYGWAENHVLASGLASQRNPLGGALLHLLAHPNGINARIVTGYLASELVKQNRCNGKESWDIADSAITYWIDKRCPVCKGTGVLNIEQDQCQECSGTGRKVPPKGDKVNMAISVIESHLEWMEAQLAKKLS